MLFTIIHKYDVDGGFGDAIAKEDILGYLEFNTENECKEWCEKHSNTHVYDIPYADLYRGTLAYNIINITTKDKILPDYWNDMPNNTYMVTDNEDEYPDYEDEEYN